MGATKHQVHALHRDNPQWTASDIAHALGCLSAYVRATASRNGWSLPKARQSSERERLRRAAPELLAALRLAESFMAGFEGDEMQDGIDERLAGIRAALAKARGEKP